MTIADALLDRIMQRHHRITLTGDSMRQERQEIQQKGQMYRSIVTDHSTIIENSLNG